MRSSGSRFSQREFGIFTAAFVLVKASPAGDISDNTSPIHSVSVGRASFLKVVKIASPLAGRSTRLPNVRFAAATYLVRNQGCLDFIHQSLLW
jgi:hypothetical protein